MTIHITKTKALQLLKNAVERKGADYVYPSVGNCKYVVNKTKPSCLVGEALLEAGVPPSRLYGQPINKLRIDGIVDRLGDDVVIDRGAVQVFGDAQDQQDTGETWGTALKAARRRAREIAKSRR